MKFIKSFSIFTIVFLVLIGSIVIYFDPFYHYHGPASGLKEILGQPEYQVIGTIKNYDYDSVIVGSSMAENYNNNWFNGAFDCTTIKLIKTGGTTSELAYYLGEAFDKKHLKNVFYSLDVSALLSNINVFPDSSMPKYLYDNNPFNDVEYLFNKDVLFKQIPYMIAQSKNASYIPGDSYSFYKDKNFSTEGALANYTRPDSDSNNDNINYKQNIADNISIIENFVVAHPDTHFYIFIPTYSCLWWDNAYYSGTLDTSTMAIKKAAKVLAAYDNVTFYCFANNKDISDNLDYYMDSMHFTPSINKWIADEINNPNSSYIITPDNLDNYVNSIIEFSKNELKISSGYLDN